MGRGVGRGGAWGGVGVCVAGSLGAEAATSVRLQSQPGDPTLDGAQKIEYDEPGTGFYSFTVTPNSAGGVDFLRAPKCGSTVCAPSSDYVAVQFAPIGGQPFGVGTYQSVQRYTSTPASHPGLLADVMARNNDRCPAITGSYVVKELARAADGTVLRFAADFEQHCNAEPPAPYPPGRVTTDL